MANLKIKEIWVEIEQIRENLYDIVRRKGIKSQESIQASQKLDDMLNKYYF